MFYTDGSFTSLGYVIINMGFVFSFALSIWIMKKENSNFIAALFLGLFSGFIGSLLTVLTLLLIQLFPVLIGTLLTLVIGATLYWYKDAITNWWKE